jgi:hypothetical protein
MKQYFVYNGRSRLADNWKRLAQLKDTIRARHKDELAEAVGFKGLKLRWLIWKEYRQKRRKIVPSPYSLF